MKNPFMPHMAYVINQTEEGYYFLSDNHGFVMDCEDMVKIAQGIFEFVDNYEGFVPEYNEQNQKEFEKMMREWKEDAQQPKPKPSYYIYMMKCNGKYKIGASKNVERRRKDLDNRPFPVEIVCTSRLIEGGYTYEQRLHNELEKYRVGGEWYDFDEDKAIEIKECICSL